MRDHLFASGDLDSTLRAQRARALASVVGLGQADFAGGVTHAVDMLIAEHTVVPLRLVEEQQRRTLRETRTIVTDYGRRIEVAGFALTVEIPFEGDSALWQLRPSHWQSTLPVAEIAAGSEGTDVVRVKITLPDSAAKEEFDQRIERELDCLRFYIDSQRTQVERFNEELRTNLAAEVDARFRKVGNVSSLATALGAASVHEFRGDTAHEKAPRRRRTKPQPTQDDSPYDVFLSHASEDKIVVRRLATRLGELGLRVWIDHLVLKLGDSLRAKIDEGLARCRYGVVVLSPNFFRKHWPQLELNGLAARESMARKILLPVWYSIDRDAIAKHSPILADRLGVSMTDDDVEAAAQAILDAVAM